MFTLPHHLSQEDAPEMWVHFRALEWFALPAFLSQPLLPFILALFPKWELLLAIYCADILWRFVCHLFVSVFLARVAYFIWRLRWLSAILSCLWLFSQGHAIWATVAILWPVVSTWMSVTTTYIARGLGSRANLAAVEARFVRSVGIAIAAPQT
jgi:hypothetical protein